MRFSLKVVLQNDRAFMELIYIPEWFPERCVGCVVIVFLELL